MANNASNMTQPDYWFWSIVISSLVFIMSIVNIIVTSKNTKKVLRATKNNNIDIWHQEKLYTLLSEFLSSTDHMNLEFYIEKFSDKLITLKTIAEMIHKAKKIYNEVILHLGYCYTDTENFEKEIISYIDFYEDLANFFYISIDSIVISSDSETDQITKCNVDYDRYKQFIIKSKSMGEEFGKKRKYVNCLFRDLIKQELQLIKYD